MTFDISRHEEIHLQSSIGFSSGRDSIARGLTHRADIPCVPVRDRGRFRCHLCLWRAHSLEAAISAQVVDETTLMVCLKRFEGFPKPAILRPFSFHLARFTLKLPTIPANFSLQIFELTLNDFLTCWRITVIINP